MVLKGLTELGGFLNPVPSPDPFALLSWGNLEFFCLEGTRPGLKPSLRHMERQGESEEGAERPRLRRSKAEAHFTAFWLGV